MPFNCEVDVNQMLTKFSDSSVGKIDLVRHVSLQSDLCVCFFLRETALSFLA